VHTGRAAILDQRVGEREHEALDAVRRVDQFVRVLSGSSTADRSG
jgi:hypothetical protein